MCGELQLQPATGPGSVSIDSSWQCESRDVASQCESSIAAESNVNNTHVVNGIVTQTAMCSSDVMNDAALSTLKYVDDVISSSTGVWGVAATASHSFG